MSFWSPDVIDELTFNGQFVLAQANQPDAIVEGPDVPAYWQDNPDLIVDVTNRLIGFPEDVQTRLAGGLQPGETFQSSDYVADPNLVIGRLQAREAIQWTPQSIPQLQQTGEYILVRTGQPDSILGLSNIQIYWNVYPDIFFAPEVRLAGSLEDIASRVEQYGLSAGALIDLATYNQDPATYQAILGSVPPTGPLPTQIPQVSQVIQPTYQPQPTIQQVLNQELPLNWSPEQIPELTQAHEFVILLPNEPGRRIHISEIPKYWSIYSNLSVAPVNRLVAEPNELDAVLAQFGIPAEQLLITANNYINEPSFMNEFQAATQYRQSQLAQNLRTGGTTLGGYAQAMGIRPVSLATTSLTQVAQPIRGGAGRIQTGLITSVPASKPPSRGRGGRAPTNIVKQLEDMYMGKKQAKRADQNQIQLPNGQLSASYLDVSEIQADGTGAKYHAVPRTTLHSHRGPIQYLPVISRDANTLLYAINRLPEEWFTQTNGQPGYYIPGTRQEVLQVAAAAFGVRPGPGAPAPPPAAGGIVGVPVAAPTISQVPVLVPGVAMAGGLASTVGPAQVGAVLPVYGLKPSSRGRKTQTQVVRIQPVSAVAGVQPGRPTSTGIQPVTRVTTTQGYQPIPVVAGPVPTRTYQSTQTTNIQPVSQVGQTYQPIRPVSTGTNIQPVSQPAPITNIQPVSQVGQTYPIRPVSTGAGIRPVSVGPVPSMSGSVIYR